MNSLARILTPLDLASSLPLYQQLQRAIREAIATHVLGPDDALPAERQIAADLSVSGDAGLLVERVGFLRDGQAVEFCQSFFRGDTYDFVAELSSTGE